VSWMELEEARSKVAHGELKLCSSESLDVVQQVVDTWESCWTDF
jgi:hypothetical protein